MRAGSSHRDENMPAAMPRAYYGTQDMTTTCHNCSKILGDSLFCMSSKYKYIMEERMMVVEYIVSPDCNIFI